MTRRGRFAAIRVLRTQRRVKGNWRDFSSTIGTQTATQTRSLDETADGGGCANEYERIDMIVGNAHSTQQLTYDEAGLMWLKYWDTLMMPKLQRIVWEQERQKREETTISKWRIEADMAEGEAMWGKPTVCD